ncbi:MAG: hypothetical protein GY816_15715 [Cytophagales bacterium]|nr:hypothetical protein [Cytophagales bacterium]
MKKNLIVIATHHKTGHHLMANLFRKLSKVLEMRFYDISKMDLVPDDADIIVYEQDSKSGHSFSANNCDIDMNKYNIKGIHSIRNPYEVIVSSYNWHKQVEKEWIYELYDGISYKDQLLMDGGLMFEMRNRSRHTILAMLNWDYSDDRFLNIKLEDFYDDFNGSIQRMAKHLGLDSDVMIAESGEFDMTRNLPNYATNRTGKKYKFPSILTKEHLMVFDEIFPSHVFSRLGYEDFYYSNSK